jgi:hypothetical protein
MGHRLHRCDGGNRWIGMVESGDGGAAVLAAKIARMAHGKGLDSGIGKPYIGLNAKYCCQCNDARPDDAITMKKDGRNQLDLNEAQFSQLELCEAAGITMSTANNWILTGVIRPAHVGGRRTRKPRSFSLLTVYEAKATAEMTRLWDMQPLTAAAIARRTTAKGHTWYLSIPEHLARGSSPLDYFGIVFWSDQCRDWDVWVDPPIDDILRINLKTIAEKRGEPRLAERPILVLPVSRYFVAVYKTCQAMVEASPNAAGA